MRLRNDFGQYPVADPEWEMRGIHPHRHTVIFAIEKYRQSLACLALCLENKLLQPKTDFWTQNA